MTAADGPDVATLLADARIHADRPALLPLRPTLFPPGASLVRTFTGHEDWVTAVAVTPDGRRALSGSTDKTLCLWDLASGAQLRLFEGHRAPVTAVAVTPDGRHALSGLYDGTLRLWDLESGAELAAFCADAAIQCCAVAQDRNRTVAGDALGRIHVLDILD